MSRWHRMGWPPPWVAFVLIALVGICDVTVFGFLQVFDSPALRRTLGGWLTMTVLLCHATAALLAVYRLQRYPTPGSGYGVWLSRTVWNGKQRLPFGPWHPVWFDLVVLALLGVVAAAQFCAGLAIDGLTLNWATNTGTLACLVGPSIAFLCAWVVGGYLQIWKHWDGSIYVIAMWVGCLANLGKSPEYLVAFLPVTLLLALFMTWRRMTLTILALPQSFEGPTGLASCVEKARAGAFASLAPRYWERPAWATKLLTTKWAIAMGVLVFVWLSIPSWGSVECIMVPMWMMLLSLFRLLPYVGRQTTHLNLPARWATRRLIVPAYDRVYITPLVMTVTSLIIASLGSNELIAAQVAGPLAFAVPVVIALVTGPDHKEWSLTAPCRYAPNAGAAKKAIK